MFALELRLGPGSAWLLETNTPSLVYGGRYGVVGALSPSRPESESSLMRHCAPRSLVSAAASRKTAAQ